MTLTRASTKMQNFDSQSTEEAEMSGISWPSGQSRTMFTLTMSDGLSKYLGFSKKEFNKILNLTFMHLGPDSSHCSQMMMLSDISGFHL
jgi:hypothetical protein